MNNVLALQMLSEDVGGTVEEVTQGTPGTGETVADTENDWGHGHGHGGSSRISLLLCR